MARVTSVRGAPPSGRPGPRQPSWHATTAVAVAAAAVVLAMYLAHPLFQGFRLPVGPDGPVYTWWTRFAEVAGVSGVAAGRPGVPAAALVLGGILGTRPVETIALLGPVLAVVCGLAGAAVLDVALVPRPWRTAMAILVTGGFAAYLAGGWLANAAQAALFLGAVACFAVARRSWPAVWLGAALLVAAGLSHHLFLVVAVVILAGLIAGHLPQAARTLRAGGRLTDTVAGRVAIAGAVGSGLAGLGLAAASGAPAVPGDTSQDGFFRRLGLEALLEDRYRERLAGDGFRASGPLLLGVGMGAMGLRGLRAGEPADGVRYVAALLGSWAAITGVGIVALLVTGWGPPNRLLVFGFFLPLGAAAGLEAVRRRSRPWAVAALALAALFAGMSVFGWYRQSPALSEEELAVARRAGRVVTALPAGTSVLFLVETAEPAPGFHVTRFANVIRMGLPPERLPDAQVVVSAPRDFLDRRPTLTGDPEHDALVEDSLVRAEPVRDRAAVLVLEPFAPRFASAPGQVVAPGVKHLAGPAVAPTGADVGPGPLLSPVGWGGLSMAMVALLAALGGGWARWALGGARAAVVGLAPAAGLAVAVLGGVAADLTGGSPRWPGGLMWTVLLAGTGYAAAGIAAIRRVSGRD